MINQMGHFDPAMTSRERILAAIEHREPDRVPLDLGATPSSGISAIAYGRLARHVGLTGSRTRVYDVVQQLAQPEDEMLDRLGIDCVDVGRMFNTADADWRPVTLSDGSAADYPRWFEPAAAPGGAWRALAADGTELAVQLPGMDFFDQTCFPWLDDYPADFSGLPAAMAKVHWAALAHSPWDHAGEPGFWERLRAEALALRAASDRAIMVVVGCNLFEWGTFLRRMDNFLMDLSPSPAGRALARRAAGNPPAHAGKCLRGGGRCRRCAASATTSAPTPARSWRRPSTGGSSSRATPACASSCGATPACTPSCIPAARSTPCCPT
jgi:hypothetical protein